MWIGRTTERRRVPSHLLIDDKFPPVSIYVRVRGRRLLLFNRPRRGVLLARNVLTGVVLIRGFILGRLRLRGILIIRRYFRRFIRFGIAILGPDRQFRAVVCRGLKRVVGQRRCRAIFRLLHQLLSQLRPDVGIRAVEEQALRSRRIVGELAIERENIEVARDVLDQPLGVVFVEQADVAGELQPADERGGVALAVLVVGGVGDLAEVIESVAVELRVSLTLRLTILRVFP